MIDVNSQTLVWDSQDITTYLIWDEIIGENQYPLY